MGQSNSPSENYLFLNVMVNFVIVNQKLTGSALHIEKNQTIGEVNVEIEHLLKESNMRNPGYFIFAKIFSVIVMKVLYVHGAEVFAKTK